MISISVAKQLASPAGPMMLRAEVDIKEGELLSFYGPSGAGKTTLLRMICGLTLPDEGRITVHNEVWFDSGSNVHKKPQHRNVGIVFQEYALFPNMTVRGNLEYALDRGKSKAIVDDLLEMMELTNLHDKRPYALSGGQRQRVALARAIVRRPGILLLDEPMSALDTDLRLKIQDYILKVHKEFKLTTILVSHDVFEVLRLCSRVVRFEQGNIVADGKPMDILPVSTLKAMIQKLL